MCIPRIASPLPALLAVAVAAALPPSALADDTGTERVFELGTVTVKGDKSSLPAPGESVLDGEQIQRYERDTVGDAVSVLPGASLSRNSRNEDIVYLRGFDARQVPVFLDGVPLYVPYDGYVDFGRFTTFDLSEIRVAKGSASLLYGPNAMGGAINLVTRRPTRPFEGDVRIGAGSGGERKAAVNLGGRRDAWYWQVGLSYLDADGFPLPHGFRDYKSTPTDSGGERANAWRTDKRLSLKLGYTPNDSDEYALGYVRQEGEKGNPVYTGKASSGIRYWRWPYWDKDSLYFIADTRLGAYTRIKSRLYRDTYSNGLEAYSNGSYRTRLSTTSFPSYYDDEVRGASVTLGNTALPRQELQLALHYKEDRHTERNPKSDTRHYRDATTSLALEDSLRLAAASRLRLGASYDQRDAREVYYWPTGSTHAVNGLAEYVHGLQQGRELFVSVARKTRFPTIKDRYSARMGSALPNPDLKPERALHFEVGVRGSWWTGSQLEAALFHSRIDDLIQTVTVASDQCGGSTCNQAQNIAKARHQGIELSLEQRLGERWRLGGSYTWLDRDNLSERGTRLTDSPRQRLFAHLDWNLLPDLQLLATVEAEQGRWVSYASTSTSQRELPGYAIAGLKAIWDVRPDLSVDVGVRNLGDKWYELADGYPMPGRSWFANASWRF